MKDIDDMCEILCSMFRRHIVASYNYSIWDIA